MNNNGLIWFKACPRCAGDVCADEDHYGKRLHCLQCGYAED